MNASRVFRIVALVLGVVLIAGAFVLAFVITPALVARLPSDTDAQRSYAGTFRTLLDAKAVASGNLAAAFKQNVPMTVDQRVQVTATSDGTARVADSRTTSAAGNVVEKTSWQYALDRKSLEPVSDHPSSWTVVDAKGLTVGFPLGTKQQDYTGWLPETTGTTPLKYARTETRSHLSTYVFRAAYGPARITDTQVLAGLPPAIPKATLALAVQFSSAPAAQKAALAALLPKLSDPVPLAYTLQGTDTFWVEPQTGVVINVERAQTRMVGLALPGSATVVPLLPVADYTYASTAAGEQAAVHDANKGRDAISRFGTSLPVTLGVLGAALILGSLLLRRKALPKAPSPAGTSPSDGGGGPTAPAPPASNEPPTGPGPGDEPESGPGGGGPVGGPGG